MRALARRFDVLEEAAWPQHRTVLIWKEDDETHEQAVNRCIAARPQDADASIIVLSWTAPHSDEAPVEQTA